jgi:hypothetical protein
MSSETIQSVAYDNYNDFQHVIFFLPMQHCDFSKWELGKLLNNHLWFKPYYQNILIKDCEGGWQQHPIDF